MCPASNPRAGTRRRAAGAQGPRRAIGPVSVEVETRPRNARNHYALGALIGRGRDALEAPTMWAPQPLAFRPSKPSRPPRLPTQPAMLKAVAHFRQPISRGGDVTSGCWRKFLDARGNRCHHITLTPNSACNDYQSAFKCVLYFCVILRTACRSCRRSRLSAPAQWTGWTPGCR